LFFMATAAYVRGGHPELLMVVAVAGIAGDRFLALGMTAGAPVGNDAGGDPLMALDTQLCLEHTLDYLGGLIEVVRIPIALHRIG
ncbi:hypothetical protein QQ73_03065, partial [Candidatus Endoriftia persephone str. Guaymas]|nr:hypothetical protein [Candidatus Endoriftia persephone str. Guaymas]